MRRKTRPAKPIDQISTHARNKRACDALKHRRFIEHVDYVVDNRGCWIWNLYRGPEGYGRLAYRFPHRGALVHGNIAAHRAAYMLTNGPLPDGYHVHHLCGNPGCINIEHMEAAHASVHSVLHKCARLEPDQIKAMFEMREDGFEVGEIAYAFGVSVTYAAMVVGDGDWRVGRN